MEKLGVWFTFYEIFWLIKNKANQSIKEISDTKEILIIYTHDDLFIELNYDSHELDKKSKDNSFYERADKKCSNDEKWQ